MIEIVEAKQASDELCAAFRSLIPQLTTTSEVPARDELQAIIEAEATKVLLAIDESRTTRSIVGVMTLVLYRIHTRKVASQRRREQSPSISPPILTALRPSDCIPSWAS
ncbi:MAG: hypothetical protein P8Z41_10290 [Anaerolineales bacterium]